MCNKDCMECGMNIVNNKCSCGMDKKPHKHAELIKAWADGAKIQTKDWSGVWVDQPYPYWLGVEYRIKPGPKPDVVVLRYLAKTNEELFLAHTDNSFVALGRLSLIIDGESGKLKSVELV